MATLPDDITDTGLSQGALVAFLTNVVALCNELKTDYTALRVDVAAIRTALVGVTAKLDADGGVTDTNYASTLDPAALTSSTIAASSLSLSKG